MGIVSQENSFKAGAIVNEHQPYPIGYARISTDEQSLDLQINALKAVGVKDHDIITEQVSGAASDRPALDLAIKRLRPGDVFVVWRLDRIARTVKELIERMNEINDSGAKFRSLSESIDTSSAVGSLIFHVLGAVAEFERQLIIERTNAGIQAAKERGVRFGHPHKITHEMVEGMQNLRDDGDLSMRQIAKKFNVSEGTVYAYTVPAGSDATPRRVLPEAKS
jgi:DNA invertase Pin-like site-specific DNA recombinase